VIGQVAKFSFELNQQLASGATLAQEVMMGKSAMPSPKPEGAPSTATQ
jgi:hypothetical protein